MLEKLKCEITLIREPLKPKSVEWRETAHHWLAKFTTPNGFFTVDYYTGMGHREFKMQYPIHENKATFNKLKHANLTDHGLQTYLYVSKPVKPDIKAIVHSLYLDSMALHTSFDYWCMDFGYDNDSISAFRTYQECCESGHKLIKLGLDRAALEKFYEDY